MSGHEAVSGMLALSAAGLLDAGDERRVREHVRECAVCASELEAFGRLAEELGTLPAPAPAADLVVRTRARVEAERERREGYLLSVAGGACACTLSIVLCLQLESYMGAWVWVAGTVIPTLLGAGAALMLTSHRQFERSAR